VPAIPTQPVAQTVVGSWSKLAGTVTFTFPGPAAGAVQTVTATVPLASPDMTFTAYVAGLQVASWGGALIGGPLQYESNQQLVIVGSMGIVPLSATWTPPALTCSISGTSEDATYALPSAPSLVSSTAAVIERVKLFSGTDTSITVTPQPGWRSLGVIITEGGGQVLTVTGVTTGCDYFTGTVAQQVEQLVPIDAAADTAITLTFAASVSFVLTASLGDDVIETSIVGQPIGTFLVGGQFVGSASVASGFTGLLATPGVGAIACKRWFARAASAAPTSGDALIGPSGSYAAGVSYASLPHGDDLGGLITASSMIATNNTNNTVNFWLFYDLIAPPMYPI
jgi:hypothetical protein